MSCLTKCEDKSQFIMDLLSYTSKQSNYYRISIGIDIKQSWSY